MASPRRRRTGKSFFSTCFTLSVDSVRFNSLIGYIKLTTRDGEDYGYVGKDMTEYGAYIKATCDEDRLLVVIDEAVDTSGLFDIQTIVSTVLYCHSNSHLTRPDYIRTVRILIIPTSLASSVGQARPTILAREVTSTHSRSLLLCLVQSH